MLQRIQTVYLVVVAVLCIAGFFSPLATFYNGAEGVAQFSNWYFSANVTPLNNLQTAAPCALGALLVIVFMLTLMTIMLFNHRMRQLRLIIVSTILLIGHVALMALLVVKFNMEIQAVREFDMCDFSIRVAGIFPLLSIIFNLLAIHGIRKDERLVRSLDRLRQ